MSHYFKKLITTLTAIATILWAMGVPMLPLTSIIAPNQAQAAASLDLSQPYYSIPSNGGVIPASSEYVGLFAFALKKESGDSMELSSVKVTLTSGGSGTLTADDIAGLAVFKGTTWDQSYSFPDADKVGEKTSGFSIDSPIEIPITTGALPTSYWNAQYLVAVKTSANWSGTDQLAYKVPANWITLSNANTLGSACPASGDTCQPSNDIYYATAPEGWTGNQFIVENVEYMGTMENGTQEVEVRFTNAYDTTTATATANYNISGTNPTSVVQYGPMSVGLVFASGVSITPNTTELIIDKDIKDLAGNVLDNSSNLSLIIMGGGGSGAVLYISEVSIGTGTSGLEEFIELYNPSGTALDFSNMNIYVWVTTSTESGGINHTNIASLTSGTVPAYGYYLIADDGYNISPDVSYDATAVDATEGALQVDSGVYISTTSSQNMGVIDRLGWGSAPGEMSDGMAKCSSSDPENCTVANSAASLERKANPSSTASSMSSGGADETNGNAYITFNNQYDFVQRSAADPQNSSSAIETPGGTGFGDSNGAPYIFHEPLYSALVGNDLVVVGEFMDDSGLLSSSNVKLFWREYDSDTTTPGIQPGSWNSVSGSQISSGSESYRFTIASSNLDADKDFEYFLRANDSEYYTCLPSPCNSTTHKIDTSQTSPNYVDIVSGSGSGVISGIVKDAFGNGIPDVFVYTEGAPFTAITNSSGGFTLSGLPEGVYDITAQSGSYTVNGTTANYLDYTINSIYISSANLTSSGNILTLIQGAVESYSGTIQDQENPWVMWADPNDNFMGFTKDRSLIVVFDKAMQKSTMTGGSSTNDNIYLVDSSGSVVAGSVIYCPDNSCYVNGALSSSSVRSDYGDYIPSANYDPYLLIYNPSSELNPGASYTLVIKDTVLGSNGKRLMGNRPSGGHSIAFSAMFDYSSGGINEDDFNFGYGGNYPPYVIGTTPGSGAFDVAVNTKINLNFNEPMDSSTINTTNIKVYTVAHPNQSNESETVYTNYSISLNTAGDVATIQSTAAGNKFSASTHYRVKVLGNCTSAKGTPMTNVSDAATAEMFRLDFETSSSSTGDSTAPTVSGTYPSNSATGVESNLPSISIGFSEGMDSSTINSNTVQLKRGTSVTSATIEYNIGDRSAYIMPANALRPSAQYTIYVKSGSSGVKDLAGNALASDYEASFTVDSTIDTTAPYLEFVNCDDFSCAVTFSEPMQSARIDDSTNYAYSVLKPSNYIIQQMDGDTVANTLDLSMARMEYDQMENTVRLEQISNPMLGQGLAPGDSFKVIVANVKDKAGNSIDTNNNSFRGTTENSHTTGGMMGPGGPGPMMGPPMFGDDGGPQMGGSMGFDFGGKWMEPINAMPMNMMAGATTQYMVEFKADNAIPSGGTIKITFPTGTDVSSAAAVSTSKSMANKDLNGPMDNTTVTIASVSKNTVARTVTVTTSGAIAANDFIMFNLKGIKNPTVPKNFDTNGYTADIKTFNTSGVLLQSETTMPYFISESGDYTLTGTITATGATGGTASVYVDSWQTGPIEDEVTFSNGSAAYEFTGLPEGDYHIHTEPSLSLTGGTYIGYMKPEPVWVSSSNNNLCSSTTCTKDFSVQKEDSSTAYELTVYIVGDFSSLPASDSEIDIFAGGPNGHTVKTIDLNQANCTGTSCSYNLYLPSAGEWWVGMGPAMPQGTMMMGPPPMPSWMPPTDVRVNVSGDYASASWQEDSNTANDGKISFTVSAASNQIIGYVVDSSGNAISNVDVNAHRTQGEFGGMPSHAQTDSTGKFTLKVGTGVFEINAWMPGLPWSPSRVVDVQDDTDSGAIDGNSTADVYKDNGTTLVIDTISGYDSANPETELLIKLNKTSTTISGQLLDNNGNPVAYAPVWAYNSSTGENRPSGTDSSGNYTLYVPDGDWYVEADIPGLGNVSYANNPVRVSGSNRSDINIRPSSNTNFYTISGTITIGGQAVNNANVWVDRNNYHNQTNTNSSGEYRLTVPANSGYSLKVWTPEYGDLEPITVDASAGDVTQNFTVASMNTLTINFTGYNSLKSNTEAFVDVFDPSAHKGNHKYIDDLSTNATTTLSIKDGSNYEINVHIPGIGGLSPTCAGDTDCTAGSGGEPDVWSITKDKTVTIDLTALGNLYTVTVTVNTANASSTVISDAFVWVGSSSFHAGEPTNSSGVASIKVPAGTYKLGADKPGYTSPIISSLTVDSDTAQTISLTSNPYTLSGYIYTDANSNGSYDNGEGIGNAWVWADKVTSASDFSFAGGWTGTESDPDGYYELSISDGYWLVEANSDAYQKTTYKDSNGNRAAIQINSASVSNKNIALNARIGYSAKQPKQVPVTPANGGTIDDSNNTGVKLTIPPSALGTSTSAGTVNISETYAVPETDGMQPIGEKGYELGATNSCGQAITNLSGSATVEIAYNEADIPTGVNESDLFLAYFDNSSGEWVELPATVDSTNNKITGSTTHFSRYIVGSSADTGAPTAVSSLSGSANSSSSVTISWTAATDSETSVDGYQILRCTGSSCTPSTTLNSTDPWSTGSYDSSALNSSTSYTDSSLSANITYTYRVVAFDTAGNHSSAVDVTVTTDSASFSPGGSPPPSFFNQNTGTAADADTTDTKADIDTTTDIETDTGDTDTSIGSAVSARVQQINRIVSHAKELVKAAVDKILALVGIKRDLAEEQKYAAFVQEKLIVGAKVAAENRYAITNFVTYGTPDTQKLGQGERAGTVDSFKSAFGRLPQTETDWEDVLKISVGRWPTQRNEQKEASVQKTFERIYLRAPERSNPNDDAAVVIMAYGLRPENRNLDSETVAIKTFKRIFGNNPNSASDWDTVRAIAYSGATR